MTARTPRRRGPRCHQGRGAVAQQEFALVGAAGMEEDGAGGSGHRPSMQVGGALAATSDFSSGSTSFAAGVVAKTGSAVTAAE